MTLQARVTILEKDVATLRSRMDNADMEREHIKRQITDLRAETHGWAEITVRVDQKMDTAADLMQLMYTDIRQTKETLAEHGSLLREHGDMLREILARLDGQRP